jgi:CrcB protein
VVNSVLVFIGGGLGSLLRYGISRLFVTSCSFFNSVFLVNIFGSLLIGVVFSVLAGRLENQYTNNVYIFLTAGFLGGFTTFSAFSLDFLNLINQNQTMQALLYVFATLFFSLLSVFIGFLIFK